MSFYLFMRKSDVLDPAALETKITALMADKEVTKNSGIYEYLLTGKEISEPASV